MGNSNVICEIKSIKSLKFRFTNAKFRVFFFRFCRRSILWLIIIVVRINESVKSAGTTNNPFVLHECHMKTYWNNGNQPNFCKWNAHRVVQEHSKNGLVQIDFQMKFFRQCQNNPPPLPPAPSVIYCVWFKEHMPTTYLWVLWVSYSMRSDFRFENDVIRYSSKFSLSLIGMCMEMRVSFVRIKQE